MTRIITKERLIVANNAAIQTEANSLEPNLLDTIPESYRYPVDRALPFSERPGFVRCWVGIGFSVPSDPATFCSYLMDMPTSLFEQLPTHKA
jgi:hypothetical protein